MSVGRPLPRPTPWANNDGGVLARVVRHAYADDNPGAGVPLQEVTWHEHLIGKPELPMVVGIPDREGAKYLSFPLRLAQWLRLGSRRREAVGCSTPSVAR